MIQDKDNEFDDLIRDAADKYAASGAAPDWEKMEGMLDAHLPAKKGGRRRILFLLIPLFFLLLGGTYFYLARLNNKEPVAVKKITGNTDALKTEIMPPGEPQQAAPKPAGTVQHEPASTGIESVTKNDVDNNKNSSLQNEKVNKPVNSTLSAGEAGPAAKNNITGSGKEYSTSSLQRKKTTSRKQNEVAVGNGKINRKKNKTAGNLGVTTYGGEVGENNRSTKTVDDASSANKNDIAKNNTDSINDISTPVQNKIADTSNRKLSEKIISPEIVTNGNKKIPVGKKNKPDDKKEKADSKRKKTFEVSLIYAPELTTIRFTNIDKPGSNYGILLGYDISKKVTLQTGVLRSRKNYIANGGDYKSGYTVPPPYKLTSVKGYCNMYEIPLNVKYKISQKKDFSIFAIAGISSYFMTSEYYTFKYNSPGNSYDRSREYDTQKNYWFSLATIAAGFEKGISKKFSVGATPYLKIPFKGMGSGDLKLLSTGINFSLSYRPSF